MKRLVVWISIFMCALQVGGLIAYCCNGDGCPYSLARYVDAMGTPTGKYALLDEDNKPLKIKAGPDCACVLDTTFPAKTCPDCLEARCPRPECGHHIFQHSCALNVRAVHGTGIIDLLHKGEQESFGEETKASK